MIEPIGQLSTRLGVLNDLGSKSRLLLLFPALAVLSVGAELVYLDLPYYQDPDPQDLSVAARALSSVGLLAWNAVLPAALVALLVITARFWPRGTPVAIGTCILFSAAVVTLMVSMMAGPDAFDGLLLLLLPLEAGTALLPFVGLTALVHWLRRRKQAGKPTPLT